MLAVSGIPQPDSAVTPPSALWHVGIRAHDVLWYGNRQYELDLVYIHAWTGCEHDGRGKLYPSNPHTPSKS